MDARTGDQHPATLGARPEPSPAFAKCVGNDDLINRHATSVRVLLLSHQGSARTGTVDAMKPWNLALRFALELVSLAGIGLGARAITDGWISWPAAIVAPLAAAVAWGTFAVPDDPSRSGEAPVPVPGWARLVIEVAVFGLGFAGLRAAGWSLVAWIDLACLVIHHAASLPRLQWLLSTTGRSAEGAT
jgi:hypothetical protein